MKKVIVGLVAAALVGCAAVPKPKTPAQPARPIAAIALVCGENTLEVLYLVFNTEAMIRFTKEDTVLIAHPGATQVEKSIGPSDLSMAIDIASQATVQEAVHVPCTTETKQ